MIFMIPIKYIFTSYSHRFVGIDNTSIFGFLFPNTAAGFTATIYWCFTKHCCWHRNFQLSTSVFMVCFNCSSSYSMKKRRSCLALSSFGFSMIHFCFALRFDAADITFHISGHTLSGLEVVGFLVSLFPDHVCPSSGLSFNKMNLVKPVHAFDNFLSPSMFQ